MANVILIYRLRYTPMRDLVRGRVSGRLDWRGRLASAPLPSAASTLIERIVRRTRLSRLEKAGVADELIAHFLDGLASGAHLGEVIHDFGDERIAAKLIRRAVHRNRPLAWHALKWTRRGFAVLLMLYAIVFARFLLGRPSVKVDYIARLNAPSANVPIEDRAWPVYRRAMLALGMHKDEAQRDPTINKPLSIDDPIRGTRHLYEATPADPEWPQLTSWLDAHADALELARAAGKKPAMGFILGRGGSQDDPELGWAYGQSDPTLLGVLLPSLNHVRQLATLLATDLRYARASNNAARLKADIEAMLDLARHQGGQVVIAQLVSMGIYHLAFQQIEETLATRPELMEDRHLIELAHALSTIGGDTASSLIDLQSEHMAFYDIIQRLYTDDGNGNGRLTHEGARYLGALQHHAWYAMRGGLPEAGIAVFGSAMSAIGSRRELVEEYDYLMNLQEQRLARPLRDRGEGEDALAAVQQRVTEIKTQPLKMAKSYLVGALLPQLSSAARQAEQLLGRREGLVVGVALEMHRRRHGSYPATLAELSPTLLPCVPADRIDGEPIRYRLADERPIVYSVGVDRDDDGGRPYVHPKTNEPSRSMAAQWPTSNDTPKYDGDWILYDGRSAEVAATPSTQPR